jgi:hypothetical protein
MKTHHLGKILHSKNLRKLAKPAALFISAFLIISMISVFLLSPVQAATGWQWRQRQPTPKPTPKPTGTPTPKPTPTPTPQPTTAPNGNNLAVIPGFWSYSGQVAAQGWGEAHSVGSPTESRYFAYPVTQGGRQNCIEMDHNPVCTAYEPDESELDGTFVKIQPGDHVVFTVWLWTGAATTTETNSRSGAVIGIDMFGSSGRIGELSSSDGKETYPNYPATMQNVVVHYGSNAWVQVTMNFVVQSQYMADPWSGVAGGQAYSAGTMVTPTHCCPWICGFSSSPSNEYAKIYVCGAQLTITP